MHSLKSTSKYIWTRVSLCTMWPGENSEQFFTHIPPPPKVLVSQESLSLREGRRGAMVLVLPVASLFQIHSGVSAWGRQI